MTAAVGDLGVEPWRQLFNFMAYLFVFDEYKFTLIAL